MMSKVEQLTTINGRLSRDNEDYKKSNSKLVEDNKKFLVLFKFHIHINLKNFILLVR